MCCVRAVTLSQKRVSPLPEKAHPWGGRYRGQFTGGIRAVTAANCAYHPVREGTRRYTKALVDGLVRPLYRGVPLWTTGDHGQVISLQGTHFRPARQRVCAGPRSALRVAEMEAKCAQVENPKAWSSGFTARSAHGGRTLRPCCRPRSTTKSGTTDLLC